MLRRGAERGNEKIGSRNRLESMLAPNDGAGRAAKKQGNQQKRGKAQQDWQVDGLGLMGSAHADDLDMVMFHF